MLGLHVNRQPEFHAKPVWFVWQILGEPTTRFSNIFSTFVTNDAVLHKPISNIRNKSKFVNLQAYSPCARQVEAV